MHDKPFAPRCKLSWDHHDSVLVCSGAPVIEEEDALQESAAVRVVTLALTMLTAFAVHSAGDKDVRMKSLIAATWRVSCYLLHQLCCSSWQQCGVCCAHAALQICLNNHGVCYMLHVGHGYGHDYMLALYRWCMYQKAAYWMLACWMR